MAEVVRGASVAFLMKILAAGLSFGLNVLLARLLGAEGAGLYFLSLTVVTAGMTIGRFGLDNTILRFIAAHVSRKEWDCVKGVYKKSIIISATISISVSLILVMMSPWLSAEVFKKPDLTQPLRWMSLSILPLAMLFLHSEAIKALKRIRDSQLVNGVILPFAAVCGLLILAPHFGVIGAVWSHTAAATISAISGWFIWRYNTQNTRGIKGEFSTSNLLQSSIPLLWVALMGMIINWSSTLLLGIWGTKVDVGIYGAASRTSILTSFILLSVNSIAAPKFAALYAIRDIAGLERVARQSTKMMILMATPVLLVFITVPSTIMGIFGPDFSKGGPLLAILALGQFVNVATGSVGYILMMTGNEKLLRNNTLVIGLGSILMGLLFIPLWGSVGAAVTTSCSVSILNLGAYYLVWKKIGIKTI